MIVTKRDAMWAHFAMLCLILLGIGIGVLCTRIYYNAHPTCTQTQEQPK